jgi:hypothetical protein
MKVKIFYYDNENNKNEIKVEIVEINEKDLKFDNKINKYMLEALKKKLNKDIIAFSVL